MVFKILTKYLPFQSLWFWLLLAGLVGGFYLIVLAWDDRIVGFPLDDAWIHQTYARNFAYTGQLAFVPGIPSAGSTAPLWTLLLSIGYLIGIPFKLWAYSWGIIFLGVTSWLITRLWSLLFPETAWLNVVIGLFCLLEWHLVWAAVSGMETLLFIMLSVAIVTLYVTPSRQQYHYGYIGLLGGLLLLTRPEGAGLIGLIGLDIAYRWWRNNDHTLGQLLQQWGSIILGVGILFLPYVLFHLSLTGKPLPNTFYAKQAEYAIVLQEFPLWWRLFGNIAQPIETVQGVFFVGFIGGQFLLLPGLGYAFWLTIKEQRTTLMIVWGWWVSFLLLYGFLLPVTYQHGRYQIPAIVWPILLGLWGTARFFQWGHLVTSKPKRIAGQVVALSLTLSVLAFLIMGASAYQRDVQFINQEMVQVAQWLDTHVPATALLAVHDIGAIGYITQRPLIDLAGLITPAVIPIIRDEAQLMIFLQKNQADYLVTFPSWYPHLTNGLTMIYCTRPNSTIEQCQQSMVVYKLAH